MGAVPTPGFPGRVTERGGKGESSPRGRAHIPGQCQTLTNSASREASQPALVASSLHHVVAHADPGTNNLRLGYKIWGTKPLRLWNGQRTEPSSWPEKHQELRAPWWVQGALPTSDRSACALSRAGRTEGSEMELDLAFPLLQVAQGIPSPLLPPSTALFQGRTGSRAASSPGQDQGREQLPGSSPRYFYLFLQPAYFPALSPQGDFPSCQGGVRAAAPDPTP